MQSHRQILTRAGHRSIGKVPSSITPRQDICNCWADPLNWGEAMSNLVSRFLAWPWPKNTLSHHHDVHPDIILISRIARGYLPFFRKPISSN